ncbi:MAG TPA: cupin domain-containing protein [Caldilineaceae bacterium]|nr:cupin domain-containing protein [Caldilineaceae bacterium]
MSFEVYDYRTTNRNVLVTPEIRARLYHMKPGQVDGRHSHDLGHEVFLILEGQAEFNINGEKKVLGPGQMCIALADEIHQVRNLLPDQETVMYLSVTPHIHPTHTGRNDDDSKQPPRFGVNANYHAEYDLTVPIETLLERHVAAAQAVADAAVASAQTQVEMSAALQRARAAGDQDAAVAARNAMWEASYRLHKSLYAADEIWNEFSPRAVEG